MSKTSERIIGFQNNLIAFVKNVKFRKCNKLFQTKLNKVIKSLHKSNKTVTLTDKTTNLYRLTKEEHDKLLQNAVTSKHKKVAKKDKKQNKQGRQF